MMKTQDIIKMARKRNPEYLIPGDETMADIGFNLASSPNTRKGEWKIYTKNKYPLFNAFKFNAAYYKKKNTDDAFFIFSGDSDKLENVETTARVLSEDLLESRLLHLPHKLGKVAGAFPGMACMAGVASGLAYGAYQINEKLMPFGLLIGFFPGLLLGVITGHELYNKVKKEISRITDPKIIKRLEEDLPKEAYDYFYGASSFDYLLNLHT